MPRDRYRVHDNRFPHLLTCTVVDWLPVFTRPEAVQIVLDSWRYLQSQERLTIYAYVVMENHLHFIAKAQDLELQVANFKSYTARRLIDLLKTAGAKTLLCQFAFKTRSFRSDRDHQFWEQGSHPKQIQDTDMMRQKIEYLHNNPVKRGYVDDPVHWRYSNARNYAGLSELIEVSTDRG